MSGVAYRRARAELRAGAIHVMDADELFDPADELQLVDEFLRILGSDDLALRFTERYGLLHSPTTKGALVQTREIRDLSSEARDVVSLYHSLWLIAHGKRRGHDELHTWSVAHPKLADPKAERHELVSAAQQWVARTLNARGGAVRYEVRAVATGRFERAARPTSLIGHIFQAITEWIVTGRPVAICDNPEHKGPFLVRDARMDYCSKKCWDRARYRKTRDLLRKERARRPGRKAK